LAMLTTDGRSLPAHAGFRARTEANEGGAGGAGCSSAVSRKLTRGKAALAAASGGTEVIVVQGGGRDRQKSSLS